jgi:hypothetical protein
MKWHPPTADELAVRTVALVMALCWVCQRRRQRQLVQKAIKQIHAGVVNDISSATTSADTIPEL